MLMIGFFLAGSTKKDAMLMAGFSKTTAQTGHTMIFGRPAVRAEIARQQEALREKYELDEDWIIQRAMHMANAGEVLAKFKIVEEDGSLDWDFTGATQHELAVINELTISYDKNGKKHMKIGSDSTTTAMTLLMRKMGMFQDIQINIGEVSLSERISAGRERSRAEHAKLIEHEEVEAVAGEE